MQIKTNHPTNYFVKWCFWLKEMKISQKMTGDNGRYWCSCPSVSLRTQILSLLVFHHLWCVGLWSLYVDIKMAVEFLQLHCEIHYQYRKFIINTGRREMSQTATYGPFYQEAHSYTTLYISLLEHGSYGHL